jgi:hypothetical protein
LRNDLNALDSRNLAWDHAHIWVTYNRTLKTKRFAKTCVHLFSNIWILF